MERCYILFGSNMGDKASIFEQACLLINNRCGTIVVTSSAYESEPWGFESDEWFLNRLIVLETELSPDTVMQYLLEIEAELGRVRHPEFSGYSSRTADLDILYFGDKIIHTDRLTVPHPRLHQRRFALLPLCEVIPDFVHPIFQLTQKELLEYCTDLCQVIRVEDSNKQFNN